MSKVEASLKRLRIELPTPAAPVANYVGFTRSGGLVVVSGQMPFGPDGKIAAEHLGRLEADVTVDAAKAAARLCAIGVLAQLRAAVGDLDQVTACVRLGGFIASAPEFTGHAAIMNGASDLIVEVLGEAGRHARTTIGVAGLPLGACVEVEGMFAVA